MASREQIADLINDCWAYFKTTSPPPKTIESWAAELKDIDLWNSGDYITRKFKNLADWPKNFPVAIKSLYREWLKFQPKVAGGVAGCDLCIDGFLHGVKKSGKYNYTFPFVCGHCKTVDYPYPVETRSSSDDKGYKLDDIHEVNDRTVSRGKVNVYKEEFGKLPF